MRTTCMCAVGVEALERGRDAAWWSEARWGEACLHPLGGGPRLSELLATGLELVAQLDPLTLRRTQPDFRSLQLG